MSLKLVVFLFPIGLSRFGLLGLAFLLNMLVTFELIVVGLVDVVVGLMDVVW